MKFSAALNLELFEFLATEGYFSEFKGQWKPLGLFGDDIVIGIQNAEDEVISFVFPANDFTIYKAPDFLAAAYTAWEQMKDEFDLKIIRMDYSTRYLVIELDNTKWQDTITQREVDQIKLVTEEAIKSSEYGYLLPLIKGVQIQ